MLEHRLARAERSGNEARAALGHRVEGVDGAHARLHDARRTRLFAVTAHGLLDGPPLHHRDVVVAPLGIGHDGHGVGHPVLAGRDDALHRVGVGHREGDHDLVHDPLLLDLAQPRRGRDPVAGGGQRRELPFGPEVDGVGDRAAGDEQSVHLLQVVLQTVVIARQQARGERRLEHVALELDAVADLQAAGAVENLHIGRIAYDLDDLGHHSGISRVNVADLVLRHGAVGLDDHDVGNDTVYASRGFHRIFHCLFSISFRPSSASTSRANISRPCAGSRRDQRATRVTRTR